MKAPADPGLVKRLSVLASAASVFSVVIGLSGLSGWLFHFSRLTTWGFAPVKMVANTSACFILLGISLWLLRREATGPDSRTPKLVAQTAAALASLVGSLSLAEHFFGISLGLDQILVQVPVADHVAGLRSGLMSSLTATDFFLLGLALIALDWRTRRGDWPTQWLCFAATVPTAFGLMALLLEPGTSPTSMAWPTVVTFCTLIAGLLGSRSAWAMGGLLVSQSMGARLLRRATPAALGVLSLVGWLISKALLKGSHFTWVEVSLMAVASSLALAGFIAWMAFVVERSDSQRKKVEEAFHATPEELDRLLNRIEAPKAERLLRRGVAAGFAVAIVLTMLMGFLSWRANRQAAEEADWVAHTREVCTTLELTLRHLVDVETGGRGFALTGDELFLDPYTSGRDAVARDLQRLSTLVADSSEQHRRLDLLERQANARMEASQDSLALRKKTGNLPTHARLLHGKAFMDAARATIAEMEAEEERLLEQRSQRSRSAQRLTAAVITLGSLAGVVFLSIAGLTVSREIGISGRARAKVDALNADLERRVAQRTADLGESESRLSSIIQSAMDAIITTDDQQRIVVFNAAAEKMFRCPAAEALGGPVTRFIPQRFHTAHEGHVKKFSENGATARAMGALGTLWGLRADGEEFQIEASISHVKSGGKELFTVVLRDITERVQAEAAREHLAAVVDSSDDAIISKDLNGIIQAWNRGAEKIFGYTADEAVGKPMLMVFPPELVEEEAGILARIRRGESVEHYETVRVRKDGKKIDVSVTISPIRDSKGTIVGASKIARDVTESKRAEDLVRRSEENFRMLWDSMDEAFCAIEVFFDQDDQPVDYRFLEVNPAFAKHTGMENAQGRRIRELQPQQEEYWYQILGQVARTGRSVRFENEAAQLHRWFEVHAFRVGDPHENKVAVLFSDISERKQAEVALRESEERFHTLIEQASDAFYLHDGGGRFLEVNRQACESLGYTREELLHMCVFDVEQEVDPGKARQAWERAEPGKAYTMQGQQRRKDGTTFPIEVRLSAYYVRGQKLHLGLVRDITERKRAEEAVRQSDLRRGFALNTAKIGDWDLDLTTLQATRSALHDRIFGYTEPLPEWNFDIFLRHIHPEDRERVKEKFQSCTKQGKKCEFECRIVWPNGDMRWIWACGDQTRDSSGKATRMFGVVQDITERKRAEEALRESETNFAAIVNLAPQFVWTCTPEGLNTYFNDRWFNYTGLTAEQSHGKGWLTPFHPDDQQAAWDVWTVAMAAEKTYRIEARFRAADGSYRWFLTLGEPVRSDTGDIVKWLGTCTDIDEMKRAQAELRDSEERFQAMANGIPQLAWMAEADGAIFWYNQRWFQYTGTIPEQMQGWGWQSVHDPAVLPKVMEGWTGAIATGEPFEMEFPLRRADGVFGTFLTRVMPLKDAAGRVTRWFGTNTDISERKEAEERLAGQAEELSRQAEELARSREALEAQRLMLQSVLDSMAEGLVAADETGKFILWNPAATRIVGMGAQNVAPGEWNSHYGVFLPDTVTPLPAEDNPLFRAVHGESCTAEIYIRNAELDQGNWLEISGGPLRDSSGAARGGVVAFRDITQRKIDEREIHKLNEELEERVAQRTEQLLAANQELEAFTYSVSHDLRAPLRHIGGFSKILSEDFGPVLPAEAQTHLKRIEDGAHRMGLLVDELLNLARVGRHAVHLQSARLNPIVDDVVCLLQPETEGREVTWKIADLGTAECDPILIKQVFQNLVANALKFTRTREQAVIEISQRQENGEIVIAIADNGVGFSMKYKDKLFGVFQRLHRAEDFEGTGIGLATVKRIVQKHGGRIGADAELDKGATFYFTLKSAEGKRAAESQALEKQSRSIAAGADL